LYNAKAINPNIYQHKIIQNFDDFFLPLIKNKTKRKAKPELKIMPAVTFLPEIRSVLT
jgi:hypothetical protein